MAIVERYGLKFTNPKDDLDIEMECIRRGGRFPVRNTMGGMGLPFHYERMRRILWPKLDGDHNGQRWHTLCKNEILKNKVTVLMGPGSSGKTHEASWIYLCEYFCFPEETCVLVSSTDIRGLRLRVWGEMTMLWEKAIERCPRLPGYILDSRIAITTDRLEDGDFSDRSARDMRKGIIGIPTIQGGKFIGLAKWQGIKQKRVRLIADEACFPAGTLVDTPMGKVPIEKVKSGDEVKNALGTSRVRAVFKKTSHQLAIVKSSDGRRVLCTPTHPFFTQNGWKCACHLMRSDYMLSSYEAMQVLQRDVRAGQQQQVLSEMQNGTNKIQVQTVRRTVLKKAPEFNGNVLQPILLREVSAFEPGIQEEVLHQKKNRKDSSINSENLQGGPGEIRTGIGGSIEGRHEVLQLSHRISEIGTKEISESNCKGERIQTPSEARQRNGSNSIGTGIDKSIPVCKEQLPRENWKTPRQRIPHLLQSRCGFSRFETGGRSGRIIAHSAFEETAGLEENQFVNGSWVDSVKIYQSEDIGGHSEREGGVAVYNLEIDRHPSYSVNGFLVHNSVMGPSFLSAFANLNKNEDFKAIVIGNPQDPMDPLGKAAEPIDGWSGHLEPKKTDVWKTRFMNGTCVNLIGTDSPNFDFPPNEPTRFKYLISKEKIADTLSFFAKDSIEYYSQCIGSMKIGTMDYRVITRDLCRTFGALEGVIWEGEDTVKVCGLDASYGGDRCVCGYIEFGKDIDGHVVISVGPPQIVPIIVDPENIPETQIAIWVKDYCTSHDIPPENFFHDSTGRGTLGTALGRIWSNDCNPVEFGGAPTNRIVSMDLYVFDPATQQRRLKRCDEHYDRFVSELWYQVRYVIESRQMRNFPEEVMDEMCMRIWEKLKNNRTSVETKEVMKKRVGRSPDLGDWLAICVEGARRLGFQIQKLPNKSAEPEQEQWLENELAKHRSFMQKHELSSR